MGDANQDSDASGQQTMQQPPAMPRWVKVSVIIAGVLLLVLVVLKLIGAAGQHGPGMHQSAAPQPGYPVAPAGVQAGSRR